MTFSTYTVAVSQSEFCASPHLPSESPGELVRKQSLRNHRRISELELMVVGPRLSIFNKLLTRDSFSP